MVEKINGGQWFRDENAYSTMYIKSSSFWRKRNDSYIERLSATNAHKSEYLLITHPQLSNDGYIEWRSATNVLIWGKSFKLSTIRDRITWDWTWEVLLCSVPASRLWLHETLHSIRTYSRTSFYAQPLHLRPLSPSYEILKETLPSNS